MKNIILYIVFFLLFAKVSSGQTPDSNDNNIKLFTNEAIVASYNNDLTDAQYKRLFNRIVGLINQTGTVELGYSNFFVVPRFQILEKSSSNAGIERIYTIECELMIQIMRTAFGVSDKRKGLSIFKSYTKKIFGSGDNFADATNNAISTIKSNDNEIIKFFSQSKSSIQEYYKLHCDEVIDEANLARDLSQYSKALSLYFSIPYGAPCYNDAKDQSGEVFNKFSAEDCKMRLLLIKTYVARALKSDDPIDSINYYYHKALEMIENLDPSTPSTKNCIAEITKEVAKIENRFSENEKRNWEFITKTITEKSEIEKIKARNIKKISQTYQPTYIITE